MPSRRLPLLLALVAALIGPAGASPQTPPPVSVSATTLVINGRGWGHGVGMSQWGAYGYAKHGVAYDKILAHYYPGTALAPAPVGKIRVLLVESASRVVVSSPEPFTVTGADGVVHDLPGGNYAFDWRLKVGSKPVPGPLVFKPGKAPLWLKNPYRGTFRLDVTGKSLSVVNEVALENYIRGVVSSEMPRDWPLEAIKAQAVAARSYALTHVRGDAYDVYNDIRDQVYGGISAETPSGDQAVAGTKRQVLMWNGKVASTYFFSSSGGKTAPITDVFSGAKPTPYLVSVPDPYDRYSPYHTWGPMPMPAATVSKALGVPGVTAMRPIPATGHARAFVVTGRNGDVTVNSSDVRRAFNLRSTWLRIGVLSLSRPGGDVAAGATVTLSGRAFQVDAPVLEQRTGVGAWAPGPALELQPDGTFSVEVTPSATTQFRLGTGTIKSAILRVPVSGT